MRRYFKNNFQYFKFYNKYKDSIIIHKIYYKKAKTKHEKSQICIIYNMVV